MLLSTAVKPYLFIHTETMHGTVDAPSCFCTARSSVQRWCTMLWVGKVAHTSPQFYHSLLNANSVGVVEVEDDNKNVSQNLKYIQYN